MKHSVAYRVRDTRTGKFIANMNTDRSIWFRRDAAERQMQGYRREHTELVVYELTEICTFATRKIEVE